MRYVSILLFAGLFGYATLHWGMPQLVGVAYLVASVACFAVYAIDKAAARAGRWRTSESTLLLLGLACGWPGAALAQQWLRHKSSKPSFRTLYWATVAINVGVFIYLATPASFFMMRVR
jgi:uncharacterized membrane protein YsdA (DUF1294 family)